MIDQLKKIIKDCLTENDGTSFCPFRVAGVTFSFSSIPTFIWATIHTVLTSHSFDYLAFGTSFGAICAGLGALAGGIALKAKTDT